MGHITPPLSVLENGFRLVTRSAFMNDVVEIASFVGATAMTEEEIEEAHAVVLAEMRDRVENLMPPGRYVIYDPQADAEGWMLVHDDPHWLFSETAQMLADLID